MIADIAEANTGNASVRDLDDLPQLLQQHLRLINCTKIDDEGYTSLKWRSACIRFNNDGRYRNVSCKQVNGFRVPQRAAVLDMYIFGFIKLKAIDSYVGRYGRLLVKALRYLTLSKAEGPEIDSSELVTILSELLIFPQNAFQNYIEWQTIDTRTLKAELRHGNITVSGRFCFNESGLLQSF